MKSATNILVVDDHELYVHGLRACLKDQIFNCNIEYCNSFVDIIPVIENHQTDLLFLELDLDNYRKTGFSICEEVVSRFKNVFVCILTKFKSNHLIQNAKQFGARGYIHKSCSLESIDCFLLQFKHGKIDDYHVCVPSEPLIGKPASLSEFEVRELLTRRERQIMELILDGAGRKEIEATLNISYDTYRTHRRAIFSKLSVQNDVQLTKLAIQHNFTDVSYKAQLMDFKGNDF